jgi:hypothetical protein
LDFPIEYQPHIQPVCLPHPGADFFGTLATITGWGRLEFREDRPTLLQHVEIPLISNEKCENMFGIQRTPEKIIPEMMCAATEDGRKDACQVIERISDCLPLDPLGSFIHVHFAQICQV